MQWSKRMKKNLILVWLVTFLPFSCAGCDYANLGALLDAISVVAACFPPYGTIIAAVCQVVKIGANYWGQSMAQDEMDEARAEGRQPEYDNLTRVMTGLGGYDVGAEEHDTDTQNLVRAGGQVAAVGVRTYQTVNQPQFNQGQRTSTSTWINPDTNQPYNSNQNQGSTNNGPTTVNVYNIQPSTANPVQTTASNNPPTAGTITPCPHGNTGNCAACDSGYMGGTITPCPHGNTGNCAACDSGF